MIKKLKYNNFIFFMFDNDWVGGSILGGQIWEPHITEFLRQNMTQESVFVDVGSNYGWHSILSSNLCKKIYSYEPQKLIYEQQINSIKINNINNIELFNYAIGNANEYKNMAIIDYNSNIHMGDLNIGEGGEPVEVRTLDSLIVDKYDFLKIDVQGYEKYVLEGAKNTITKYKPTIIIEIESYQLNKFKYTCDELFQYIKNLDYHIFLLDYHYASDHVCVHKDLLNDFRVKNNKWLKPLTVKNNLNNNIDNGVTEKIHFSDEITSNTNRLINDFD